MKSDLDLAGALGGVEHGAAAAARRHRDDVGDLRLDAGVAQRLDDHVPLARGISVRRQVLQRAAAAGSEMDAARAHAFCATRRNSRLPSAPSMGLAMLPTTVQPDCAATHLVSSDSAAPCASASRTTPPLPMAKRPTSNCGLTSATSQVPAEAIESAGGRARRKPMKR